MQEDIRGALALALSSLGVEIEPSKASLEFTGDLAHGDLASSVALQYAKELRMAPRALAEKIVESLGSIENVKKIDIAGPGFINFYLADSVFAQSLQDIIDNPDEWGKNALHKGEKIMVEYTDPNPFK